MATQQEIADHLDLSDRSVRDLKKRGVFAPDTRGRLDLDDCRISYIRYLRERAAGRASDAADDEGFDLQLERARLAREQADNVAMKNAQMRGELVSASAVTAAVVSVITLTKGRLARVGAKVSPKDPALRGRIDEAIEDALDELSTTRVEEEIGGGAAGDDEDEDGADDDGDD